MDSIPLSASFKEVFTLPLAWERKAEMEGTCALGTLARNTPSANC
jgi:hypothetical protein